MTDTGKLQYDIVTARLNAQKADYDNLVGRAKDLLGFATVASTILSLLAGQTYFQVKKVDVPGWWVAGVACTIAVLVVAALFVLWPRPTRFSVEPAEVAQLVSEETQLTADEVYAKLAATVLERKADDKSSLDRNGVMLTRLATVVAIEAGALAALIVLAVALAAIVT